MSGKSSSVCFPCLMKGTEPNLYPILHLQTAKMKQGIYGRSTVVVLSTCCNNTFPFTVYTVMTSINFTTVAIDLVDATNISQRLCPSWEQMDWWWWLYPMLQFTATVHHNHTISSQKELADPRGRQGRAPGPVLSFLCSFWQRTCKIID